MHSQSDGALSIVDWECILYIRQRARKIFGGYSAAVSIPEMSESMTRE